MTPKKASPKSITEYINAAPKEAQKNCVKCVRVRRVQTSHRLLSHAVAVELGTGLRTVWL